jgi:hypothetical protein
VNKIHSFVQRYLRHLENGDGAQLAALFIPEAIVDSPLRGRVAAQRFFPEMFPGHIRAQIRESEVYSLVSNPNRFSVQFVVTWIAGENTLPPIRCVDTFTYDPASDRCRELTILFDTHLLRKLGMVPEETPREAETGT